MVSVFYAVDGRSVVIIGRGGHPCVALICSVARIAGKRLMRSTVAKGDIQLIVSNVSVRNIGQSALCSWLNQLISDCRSSQTSLNHLNFFGWTPRNSSDLVAGVGLAKSDLGRYQVTNRRAVENWQSRRSDQLCLFRPPTTIIDYLLQSILMLAMLRYIDWDKFTERKI